MADTKVELMTEDTTPALGDVLYLVADPGGTPLPRKIKIENLFKLLGIVLPAGTTALAPWRFLAGTNLTTPADGALEYDGKALYASPAAARGVVPAVQFSAPASDFTLAAASGVQAVFPATADVLTVAANAAYFFDGQFILNTGATTHTTAMAFALAGGATVSSFEYLAELWSAAVNTIATAESLCHVSGVASKVLNATSTAVYTIIKFQGMARFTAGGTVTPQVNFSANPTGTNLTKVGSYLRFTPVGLDTVAAVGPWA